MTTTKFKKEWFDLLLAKCRNRSSWQSEPAKRDKLSNFQRSSFVSGRLVHHRGRMNQELKQVGKLDLQLKLTPRMLLNFQLLQLPFLKLEEAVLNEIEENPLLEVEEPVREEENFEGIVDNGKNPLYESEDETTFEIPSSTSLRDLLIQQSKAELNDNEFNVASFIIDNLDRNGYLTLSEEEISKRLSVPVKLVKGVRERVKKFTPTGCGSYNLLESFAVQLEELHSPPKFIEAVKKLELLKKGRKAFLKKTKLSETEFEEFLNYLKRLDPEPGNRGEFNVRITPDVKVYTMEGKIVVEVTTLKRFNLRINNSYLHYATNEEVKRYINEKYQRAIYLKNAIEQREKTLKEITLAVFESQKEFLKDGKTLKPLTYRNVAERISIHESTVSRAVKDKFVETPFGVYPFKHFFCKSLSGILTNSIKEEIRQIVEFEDKKKPLSDGKIAEVLKRKGIKIARRTVAKYREAMGIPTAFERKKR